MIQGLPIATSMSSSLILRCYFNFTTLEMTGILAVEMEVEVRFGFALQDSWTAVTLVRHPTRASDDRVSCSEL